MDKTNDGRALSEKELEAIQKNIFRGCYHDDELAKVFTTIAVQRKVLRTLFKKFELEPMRRVSVADPIRNSELMYLKELVALEDPPCGCQT